LLINDILDLSKIEAGKLELKDVPVNPYIFLSEIEQIFSLILKEKEVDFIINIDEEVPRGFLLDELRVRQILFNLIGNAVKFTDSGSITVSVRLECKSAKENHTDVIFEVKDTGIGIPEDRHEQIFEAFIQQEEQNTRKYGGTGLGLAITKRLIEMMKGSLILESEVGVGSTFKVHLKDIVIIPDVEAVPVEGSENFNNIVFERSRILLVEDIENNRRLIKYFLEQYDFEIIEAYNGKDAIDIAEKELPDLIIMDIQMPVLDGFQAAKAIKENPVLKHIPIIAVTASNLKYDTAKTMDVFGGYLRKPISRLDLFNQCFRFLKYSSAKESETGNDSKGIQGQVTTGGVQISESVISMLQDEVKKKWMVANEDKMINEIIEFANIVKNLGEQNSILALTEYGNKLFQAADAFQVIKINKLLKNFPDIVKMLTGGQGGKIEGK